MNHLTKLLWEMNTSQTEQLAGIMTQQGFERAINEVLFLAAETCRQRAEHRMTAPVNCVDDSTVSLAQYLEALACAKTIQDLLSFQPAAR